jgi:hypothetical protein
VKYQTSCVEADGDAINEMKRAARQITLEDFEKKVCPESLAAQALALGYACAADLDADWNVTWWEGEFEGRPCVYFTHSAIEYVFY